MSATAIRLITREDEQLAERRQFWRIVGFGTATLALCVVAIVAGIAHVEADEEQRLAYLRAQYTIKQQAELMKIGQDMGSMAVKVATIPASDYTYAVVLVPQVAK